MAARVQLDPLDTEATARLELQALEKMIGALCQDTERLAREARSRGELGSREAEFQLEAFEERRTQAARVLNDAVREPHDIRVSRLEKIVEALDCSRSYFRAGAAA
jgi:hypothetical protein